MPGDDGGTRVLLRPDVTEEMVEDLADDLGWILLGSHPPTDTKPYERVWEDELSNVRIFYVWDDLLRLAFVFLRGPNAAGVEAQIREALPTSRYDEVLEELRTASGTDAVIDAIARLTAFRRPEDPEGVELLRRAADTGEPEVRRAVITAAGYLEWPDLLRLTAALRERDPDARVRNEASIVLDAIGRQP